MQSGWADPGASMYFSTSRNRRSPFIEVRFISPDSTAGRITCAACPIWLWMMSTSTDEDAASVDCADDGIDQLLARGPGAGIHGFFHHVGAAVVDPLELGGVERGLVVVVGPDVMHLAATRDDQLVDIGCRTADMGVRGAEVTFLMSAQTADAAAFTPDVAGRKADVHQGSR